MMILPSFFIYPGIYNGRWKSQGPIFEMVTQDEAKIEGMLFQPENPKKAKTTFLFFHGNSGNMGARSKLLLDLKDTFNAYVVTIEYRGYGNCYGFPSESGLITDAKSVLERIKNDEKLKDTKIIVYGRSLGGAVSIALANEVKGIDGLILENTFTCIKDVAIKMKQFDRIPEFIFDIVLYPNSWDSKSRISNIHVPTLFISGLKDEIVNPKFMKELYNTCKSKKKILYTVEDGMHNDTNIKGKDYHKKIQELIENLK